jgi:hypothetical protein
MAAASDLPTFLESAGTLSLTGRKRLVEQALVLVDDNFVHLPLKESMHGVDPVQKLRLIQHRLDQSTSATMDSEFQFHRDMIKVFTSVRDLHTNYLLPAPFADKVAFLPFDVEEFFDSGEPHYIATHFVQGFSHTHFKRGVEIMTWNGVPIRRAIDVSADQHAGSNSAARHARGVDGLTLRALRRALPPDAMWVIIGYIDLNGVEREMKQEWIVTQMLRVWELILKRISCSVQGRCFLLRKSLLMKENPERCQLAAQLLVSRLRQLCLVCSEREVLPRHLANLGTFAFLRSV